LLPRRIKIDHREFEMAAPDRTQDFLSVEDCARVRRIVSHSPLRSLWDLNGVSPKEIARRAIKSSMADRVFDRAAELAFYFLFSLFPSLICASAIVGMVARTTHTMYAKLLEYLALVIPASAMDEVMMVFHQTAAASTSGKITFALLGAIWSASVGVSAIQDTLNGVYKIEERRSYFAARLSAIGVSMLASAVGTLCLASMFGGDWFASALHESIGNRILAWMAAESVRALAWAAAATLFMLVLAVLYYFAPDWRHHRWRWFTPGGVFGIAGWLIASLGFRVYLHFVHTFSATYGSLGAVVILLTWFYISGLMLLLGGEINSEIEAASVEKWIRNKQDAVRVSPARRRRF
jgi:membrane protein